MSGTDNSRGLLMVFTGNGKGKTTAALGMAFRALGHGQRVAVVQFIKGSWQYGEMEAAKRFSDLLEFHVTGQGFTWKSDDLDKDVQLARQGWELAAGLIRENRHHLIILDELTYLIRYRMVAEEEILAALTGRADSLHVAGTGRDASPGLIEAADLVTEMREIKHPYQQGIRAQPGIEY